VVTALVIGAIIVDHCWDGLTVVGFCIENGLQKTETVPHGFSIHLSNHFLNFG
jgi:hypothetical protein